MLRLIFVLTFATLSSARVFKMGLICPWEPLYDFSCFTSASAVSIAMEKIHADPTLNSNGQIQLRWVSKFSLNHYVAMERVHRDPTLNANGQIQLR